MDYYRQVNLSRDYDLDLMSMEPLPGAQLLECISADPVLNKFNRCGELLLIDNIEFFSWVAELQEFGENHGVTVLVA